MTKMGNFTEDALFEKLEQKVEMDVDETWQNEEESPRLKQLVILAGPQGSLLHSAHQFFIHHASQYRPNQRAASLTGWAWPWMDPDELKTSFFNVPHDRLFDLLIEHEGDKAFVQTLLAEIERTWTQDATKGIILGSEYFDQITDSARIIQQVIDQLGVLDPSQVSIILNYPSSRVTQWNRFFSIATKNIPMSYQDFICDPTYDSLNMFRLETSMNPVQLASEFRSRNWNVALLDTKGIADSGQDLAHVIGCRILSDTDCIEGNLNGIDVHPTTISSSEPSIEGLTTLQEERLESYFTDRDCFFRNDLMHDDPGFRVLFKSTLWNTCDTSQALTEYYDRLTEPNYLWNLVQSQVTCQGDNDNTNMTGIPNLNANQVVEQDISQVASSLEKQTLSGVKLISILCAIVAIFVGIVRYRKFRRSKQEQNQVLRQWKRSNDLDPEFLATTISSSVLSPTKYHSQNQNIHATCNEEKEVVSFHDIDLSLESPATRGVLS